MSLHPFNSDRPPDFFSWDVPNRLFFPPEFEVPSAKQPSGRPETLPLKEQADDDFVARIEAVLFLCREPLPARRLSQYADLPEGTKIKTLVRNLNRRYDSRQCAFRVMEVAGGFQLRTRPKLASWLVRMMEVPTAIRLGVSALETLVVIAHRQPVHRAEIERIRGVQCGELIRQLLERDLVKIVGRSEELGRPFFYGTTKKFLEVFGLGSLRELPRRELFTPEAKDSNDDTPSEHDP